MEDKNDKYVFYQTESTDARSKFQDGVKHQDNKKFEEAINCYNDAISCDEDYISFYSNRGICNYMMGKFHACRADLREVLNLNPSEPDALLFLEKANEQVSFQMVSHILPSHDDE